MIRFAIGLLLISASLCGATPSSPEDLRALIASAGESMREAQESAASDPAASRDAYAEAIKRYEAAIDAGVSSSAVYRALGNAYLLNADVGRSILSYRRAERIKPHDARVRQSLRYARSRVRTEVPTGLRRRATEVLLWWRGYVPRDWIFTGFISCYLLGWGLAIARVLGAVRVPGPVIAGSWLAGVTCLGSLALEHGLYAGVEEAVVVRDDAVGRNGPSVDVYEETFQEPIRAGVEGEILERRDGWVRMRFWTGQETWLEARAIDMI